MIPLRERNPLLDHVWGISSAQDRVWVQIAGMAPSTKPWERLFMVFQTYIDDSWTEDGVFVLAGYVASVEAWASFSKEWEKLLPTTMRGANGTFRFKMSEMQYYLDRVPPFYKLIEDRVLMSISCKIDIADLRRAKQRIWSDNTTIIWGVADDPYWITLSMLVRKFHEIRYEWQIIADVLPLDSKVDFYFDCHSGATAQMMLDWEIYLERAPAQIRELYGAMPRFESDEKFLPLQAADFWAWWMRRGYENGEWERYIFGDFGAWKGSKVILPVNITISEDQIVENMISKMKTDMAIGMLVNLYDAKVRPPRNAIPAIQRVPRSTMFAMLRRLLRRR